MEFVRADHGGDGTGGDLHGGKGFMGYIMHGDDDLDNSSVSSLEMGSIVALDSESIVNRKAPKEAFGNQKA